LEAGSWKLEAGSWKLLQQELPPPLDEPFQRVLRRGTTVAVLGADVGVECVGAVQLPRVDLDVGFDERLPLTDHRADPVPIQPAAGNVAHVREVALAQRGYCEQLRAQRLAGVIDARERIEIRSAAAEAPAGAERLVEVE